MPELRDRAVVLGASMGGLLAARVLADFYRTVTVVERDVLPRDPVNRRGVPQGSHPHALLGRGVAILAELFPGFFDQLVADGAVKWDDGGRAWRVTRNRLCVPSSVVQQYLWCCISMLWTDRAGAKMDVCLMLRIIDTCAAYQ
jgi:2-polyprenyl-6-methoxyphenol hydroxylase-like FAD-dependent oxidoreductase